MTRKTLYSNDVLIERTLPISGDLVAKVGDAVEPVTKLGMTKMSYGLMKVPTDFKIEKGKSIGSYFYNGEKMGTTGAGVLIAPFDGYLVDRKKDGLLLRQEDRDYWLLSGVWGKIAGIVEKRSVLLKTQALDFHLAASTQYSFAGELIVFPNPSPILEMQYLENFAKSVFGKVIYVGDYASESLLKRAIEMGVGGIIAGGADKYSFDLAKKNNLFLGVFSGYGNIPTPEFIFEALKDISNRFVFVQGERRLLRIPVPARFEATIVRKNKPRTFLKTVKKGMLVQVFEKPYFGWIGKVVDVQSDEIYVKLDDAEKVAKVKHPNLLAIEYEQGFSKYLHARSNDSINI